MDLLSLTVLNWFGPIAPSYINKYVYRYQNKHWWICKKEDTLTLGGSRSSMTLCAGNDARKYDKKLQFIPNFEILFISIK